MLAGRVEGAQLRLPADDLRASRRHATFELTGDDLLVEDAGSSTGTFVNDQRVQRATLDENDLVRMGTLSFRVERVTEVHKKELRDVLTALMISKRLADSSVPMSLLADHPNVQFNYYRPAIKSIEAQMH